VRATVLVCNYHPLGKDNGCATPAKASPFLPRWILSEPQPLTIHRANRSHYTLGPIDSPGTAFVVESWVALPTTDSHWTWQILSSFQGFLSLMNMQRDSFPFIAISPALSFASSVREMAQPARRAYLERVAVDLHPSTAAILRKRRMVSIMLS
jgi:hypothetical protein